MYKLHVYNYIHLYIYIIIYTCIVTTLTWWAVEYTVNQRENTRQFPVPIFFGVSMIWFSGHVTLHRKIFIQASIILGRHLPHWWIHWSNLEEWCCSSLAFPNQVFSWALWLVDWLTKDSAHLPKEWPLETHVIFFVSRWSVDYPLFTFTFRTVPPIEFVFCVYVNTSFALSKKDI